MRKAYKKYVTATYFSTCILSPPRGGLTAITFFIAALENNTIALQNDLSRHKDLLQEVEKSRLSSRKELIEKSRSVSLLEVSYHNKARELKEMQDLRAQDQSSKDKMHIQFRALKQDVRIALLLLEILFYCCTLHPLSFFQA